MPVKIRLTRLGRKNRPFFRIIAVDSRDKRDGAYLENIGTYDPVKAELITFNNELYNAWLSKGAQPSDSVKKIYRLYKRVGVVTPPIKHIEEVQPEQPATE